MGQLEERVVVLENENRGLRDESKALGATRDTLNRCSQDLTAVRRSASQTLEIEQENRKMQQAVATAHEQRRQFEVENQSLRNQSTRHWFLAGAGVAFGGLFLGLVIPRLSLSLIHI